MSAQNIYDDPEFFARYAKMRRVEGGLDAALEWPAFQRLLPPSLDGSRVLDLGCGMGHFARFAASAGAREVIGVDLSERMLAVAQAQARDPAITYHRADIAAFDCGSAAFDLIVSSLALHYVEDYAGVVARVARALKPGGRFAFSVEHPLRTCCDNRTWHCASDGTKLHWPVDDYRDQGVRETRWFVDGIIRYHRTIETYINTLLAAGLSLVRLEEPEAEAALVARWPDLADERRAPPFLLIAAEQAKSGYPV